MGRGTELLSTVACVCDSSEWVSAVYLYEDGCSIVVSVKSSDKIGRYYYDCEGFTSLAYVYSVALTRKRGLGAASRSPRHVIVTWPVD